MMFHNYRVSVEISTRDIRMPTPAYSVIAYSDKDTLLDKKLLVFLWGKFIAAAPLFEIWTPKITEQKSVFLFCNIEKLIHWIILKLLFHFVFFPGLQNVNIIRSTK